MFIWCLWGLNIIVSAKYLGHCLVNDKCSINRNNSIIAISHYEFYSRDIAKWCECSVIVAFKLIQFFSNFTIWGSRERPNSVICTFLFKLGQPNMVT